MNIIAIWFLQHFHRYKKSQITIRYGSFGIRGIRCDVPERHIFGISVRIVRNEHAFPRADVFTDPDRIDCGDMHIRTEHAAVTNRYFHRSIVLRHFMSRDMGIAADKTIVPNLNVFFPID